MITKRAVHLLVFLTPLVAGALLLNSCAASSASERSEHEEIMNALDRLADEKENLDAETRQLRIDMDRWQTNYEDLKARELRFIKAINDQQLKLYSEYEESYTSGNAGKKELCLRNLTKSLSKEQQAELVEISKSTASLDARKAALLRKNQEIAQGRQENYRKITGLMRIADSYYGSKRRNNFADISSGIQSSMQQWQQTIQQNQQRMDMWSINNSLRDIAGSLQALKY